MKKLISFISIISILCATMLPVNADWPWYNNVYALLTISDVVVIGNVISETQEYDYSYETPYRYTLQSVEVTETLVGNIEVGEVIIVRIPGHRGDYIPSVRYLEIGESYLLFLRFTNFENDLYYRQPNPIQGAYRINGNALISDPDNNIRFGSLNEVRSFVASFPICEDCNGEEDDCWRCGNGSLAFPVCEDCNAINGYKFRDDGDCWSCGDTFCKVCWGWECDSETNFPTGHILGNPDIKIADALEILKYIVGMNNVIEECAVAFDAALIVSEEKPGVSDALEILKEIVGMPKKISG